MATVSQRRKGTTYGKAYRKPLIHASFATDNLSQPAQQPSRKHDAAGTSTTTVQEDGLSRDSSDMSRNKTARVARLEQSPRINALYDPPSSDDEPPVLRRMLEDGYTESKRRKLTPSSISDDELALFDEEGLQTHTAQVRAGTAIRSRSTARPGVRQATALKGKDGKLAGTRISRTLPASKGLPRKEQLTEPLQREKFWRKGEASSQDNPIVGRNTASTQHRLSVVDAVCDHTQPYRYKGSGAPRVPVPNPSPGPTTPPQPSSSSPRSLAGTTPRQRDLWSCLLPGNGRSESPGALGLPNLRLADSGHLPFEDASPAPSRRIKRQRGSRSPPQRLRLIDKLLRTRPQKNSPGSHSADDLDANESISSEEALRENPNNKAYRFSNSPAPKPMAEVAEHEEIAQKKEMTVPTITGNGVPATLAGSLKVTYAQQQRTFLTESLDCNPSPSQLIDVSIDKFQAPKSRDVILLASRKPSYNEEYELEVQEASDLQGGTMRSIHELRQAGGNVRLAEELESFLDELEGSVIGSSSRRAALVAIVCRLQESASCRLFTDKGMEARLLSQSDQDDDLITKSLFTMAFLRLLTTSSSSFPPPAEKEMKEVLSSLLNAEQDLTRCAKRREFNMSKVALREFARLCASFLGSELWQSDKLEYLSGQLLSLQCLSRMIRRKREANDGTQLLSTGQVQLLAATTIPESAKLPSLNNAARKCLWLAISVLELCTVGGTVDYEGSWSDEVLRRVAGILPTLDASWTDDWEQLQILTLQLYLNLTNGVPYLCSLFAQTQVVETSFNIVEGFFKRSDTCGAGHGQSLLDRAILALGCLINFAEGCEAMRELVLRQTRRGQSFLQLLLDLFLENSARVAEVSFQFHQLYWRLTILDRFILRRKAHPT